MLKKTIYTRQPDGSYTKEEIITPEPVGDPLHDTIQRLADQNPGFIAVGAQASEKGVPGEISTLLIPK